MWRITWINGESIFDRLWMEDFRHLIIWVADIRHGYSTIQWLFFVVFLHTTYNLIFFNHSSSSSDLCLNPFFPHQILHGIRAYHGLNSHHHHHRHFYHAMKNEEWRVDVDPIVSVDNDITKTNGLPLSTMSSTLKWKS